MKKIVCDRCGNDVKFNDYCTHTEYHIKRPVMVGEPINHLEGDMCDNCSRDFEYEFLGKKNHWKK